MNIAAIEKSLIRIKTIETHLSRFDSDPLLIEDFEDNLLQLQIEYGQEMNEILFEIYDEHCEDDKIFPLIDYAKEGGVNVEAEDFPGVNAILKLKPKPLRFELEHPKGEYREVVWSLAS